MHQEEKEIKMNTSPFLLKQLERIAQVEPEAVERLFVMLPKRFPELWQAVVIGAYLDDEINLSKAAELLAKHPIELRRDFKKQGIPVKIGTHSLEEAEAEVKALEALENPCY
jgi:predicted HTH domain antitoxin